MDERLDLLSLTRTELLAAARARLAHGAGFAAGIQAQTQREGRFDPAALGASDRAVEAWRDAFRLDLPVVDGIDREPGAHGVTTEKAGLRFADGRSVETVRIPIGARRQSQCVSSQVGCRMACRFCETARMGLVRQLTAGEIVAQVVACRRALGWQPRSLVFQGMGEPLDNVDELLVALRVLADAGGLGFGHAAMTVCTAGHVDGIRRLTTLGWSRLNLSLSLNAADDDQRRELMPIQRSWPLAEVQRALIDWRGRPNAQLGIHWCLLPGLNDRRNDARAIARFCAPLGRIMVHLIPFNPGTAPLTRAPTEDEIVRFVGWLREEGLPVRRRITKGRDVAAACGQLRRVR